MAIHLRAEQLVGIYILLSAMCVSVQRATPPTPFKIEGYHPLCFLGAIPISLPGMLSPWAPKTVRWWNARRAATAPSGRSSRVRQRKNQSPPSRPA